MNIIRIFLIALLSFILSNNIFSQIEVGSWREHFSYKKAICVADAGDKVYVAGELGIFSYDKEEGSIEKLSKVNGLSDSEIQTIAFNKFNNTLVIAYKNSNIDILKDNVIYNITEIKRKQLSHSKTINKISFNENVAYLSCGFGIVVVNLKKVEIEDTFYIGANSSYKNINDVCVFNDKIYAATEDGLFYADVNTANLYDYRNWQIDNTIPNANIEFSFMTVFNNQLFVSQHNNPTSSIYYLKDNNWMLFKSELTYLKTISSNSKELLIVQLRSGITYNLLLEQIKKTNPYYNFIGDEVKLASITYGVLDDDSNILIADGRFGFINSISGSWNSIFPNGPINNTTAKAKLVNSKLITTNGNNKMKAWHNPEYNIFENEKWKTFGIERDTAVNFYSIAINPNDKDDIFIGAYGYGIFEFKDNNWINHFHNSNSTLQSIPGFGTGYDYIRITDLTFDNNNALWCANQAVAAPISVKDKNGVWQSFNFNGQITNQAPNKIIVTKDNKKWILLGDNKGIMVLDDNSTPVNKTDDTFKKIVPIESNGDLVSNTVTALCQDKDGNVWVGTDDGVAIYYNPENIFEDNFFADRVQLTSYGKDTTEQYLFKTAVVVDIEVDGANRKWVATKNAGVFLVSDNGKQELLNFNTSNSPLPSNSINDIAINHISGEVFILTDKGILSYRSDATYATEDFGDVYVFPNPVRPDYNGKITVTGLADEVNVKFTDVAGNLVYETTALGGQAIWDGKTFDGRKVNSGIYLVFSTNKDGSKTQISKILFMN